VQGSPCTPADSIQECKAYFAPNFTKEVQASMIKKATFGICLFACFQSANAQSSYSYECNRPDSANLFNATICIDGKQFQYEGGSKVEDLVDQFDEEQLKAYFAGYNENTSTGLFRLDFRGIPIQVSFPNSGAGDGSTLLVFEVPSLDLREEFSGTDRDDSKELLKDYLKKDGERLLKESIKQSPVDPIAGNPASMQSKMVDDAFNAGTQGDFGVTQNKVGLGARFGRYNQGGKSITSYSLPLSFSFQLGGGKELMFRFPMSYMEVEEAKAYSVGFGTGLKVPVVKDKWSLTPALSYGIAGSPDLGSAAQMLSTSLTSDVVLIKHPMFSVRMGNMVGYYKTLPFKIKDYDVDIDLTNIMLRNGFMLSVPIGTVIGPKLNFNTFITDTRFFGDDLYTEQYNEVGFSFNTKKGGFGIGMTYLYADENTDAFKVNFGFKF